MSGQTGNGFLELEVTDFGPIEKAKIDLRPLTVFLGPSNTGKSYLAILIYALHQVFSGDPRSGREGHFGVRASFGSVAEELSKANVNALLETALSLKKLEAHPESRDRDVVFSPPLADALRAGFDRSAYYLSREIGRCFGIHELGTLIRKGQKASRIAVRRRISERDGPAEHKISLTNKVEFSGMVPAEKPIRIGDDTFRYFLESFPMSLMDEQLVMEKTDRNFFVGEFLSSVADMVLPSLVGPLHLPAYYLPADRTGVMHAHSAMVGALIANAPFAGLRSAPRTPTLSGVLADFLGQLIDIGQTGRPRRRRPGGGRVRGMDRDIAERIEKSILDGAVRVDRSTPVSYPRFSYHPNGWKNDLALANASSMVSELAPVVLYLQHMIEPDNVLIIEEPESHLHPAMQVEFTRQIAALVNAGVRVIVTTHSEWLLEELANIVRRSGIPEAERGDKITLQQEQVGAWLFKPKRRPKGSTVSEIPIDESGLYPSGYDEVASVLHNEWADISSGIEGGP